MNNPSGTNLPHQQSAPSAMELKQLKALKQLSTSLSELLVKVSRFYAGIAPEIDQELQTLNGHLSGKPDYTLANISINKLNGLLKTHADQIKHQNSQSLQRLKTAVKSLQRLEHLPADVKSETARFLSTLDYSSRSIYTALPQLESALSLYHKALTLPYPQADSVTGADPVELCSDERPPRNKDLQRYITNELSALVEPFYQANKQDPQLADVRQRLLQGIGNEELLECCLVIIRVIVKDVIREADIAERFVSGLHKSLVKVNKQVGETLQQSQNHQQQRQDDRGRIQQDIGQLDRLITDEQPDLPTLKHQTSQFLMQLSTSLAEQQASDSAHHQQMHGQLEAMQLEIQRLEQKAEKYKNKLHQQHASAHIDPLTKLANRAAYDERIDIEFHRWQRHQSPLCIAILDVDYFKRINDNYGHAAGDKTLAVLARQLKQNLRKTDFAARWGGEEFVILFADTSLDQLAQPLEQIRQQLARIPFTFRDEKLTITVSIGASEFRPGDTIADAFERADANLYRAKANGRNQVQAS